MLVVVVFVVMVVLVAVAVVAGVGGSAVFPSQDTTHLTSWFQFRN